MDSGCGLCWALGPEPRKPVTPTGRGRFVAELDGARREFAHLEHDGTDFLYLNRLFRRVTDHRRTASPCRL